MNESVLNSGIETQHRMTMLLSLLQGKRYSATWLSAFDFICVYGETFGISNANLHGNRWMKFTEFATRAWSIQEGLKNAVLLEWIKVEAEDVGYLYSITAGGKAVVSLMKTKYACEYKDTAKEAIKKYGKYSEKELSQIIMDKSSFGAEGTNG